MSGVGPSKSPRLELRPIAHVVSPFASPSGTPIQPRFSEKGRGQVVVVASYEAALTDIEDFDRIWLISWLDHSKPYELLVTPFRDVRKHGCLATRVPSRPNPIGISSVRLLGRTGLFLEVAELDLMNGTPILDIKPYVPEFDCYPGAKAGWLDHPGTDREVADDRFSEG